MPFVYGFLRHVRRGWRPGRPDVSPPDPEGIVDPDYGIDEDNIDHPDIQPPRPPWQGGGRPDLPDLPPIVLPPLPPNVPWPPIRPEDGWKPLPPLPPFVPPAGGIGGRPPDRPEPGLPEHPEHPWVPGAIWPPLPPGTHGLYLALVLVAGMPGVKYRYVIVDADAGFPDIKPPARPEPK